MTTYEVTLLTPTGPYCLQCPSDLSILDVAAAQGLVLPAICRGGACSSCVAQMVAGAVPDQSEQSYLSEQDVESGYVLLCVAYACGDCTLQTHKNADYLASLSS